MLSFYTADSVIGNISCDFYHNVVQLMSFFFAENLLVFALKNSDYCLLHKTSRQSTLSFIFFYPRQELDRDIDTTLLSVCT